MATIPPETADVEADAGSAIHKPRQLVTQVSEILRSRIVDGLYPPESELPSQGTLAVEFGVSLPVVREAMRRLESLGLLAISQGKRPRVQALNGAGIADGLRLLIAQQGISWDHLIHVRRALEGEIAHTAAIRSSPELIAELKLAIETQSGAEDVAVQVEADEKFHRLLAEATGNPLFGYLLDVLSELLNASRCRTLQAVGVSPAVDGHRQILNAIAERNPEQARSAMQAHLDHAESDLRRFSM